MPVTVDQFIEYVSDLGFMGAEEIYDFLDDLPLDQQPTSARRLVQEMLRRNRLTKFQADLIFKGKTRRLVLGNYVIMERLGQGGMGRVFKARHRRMERLVALKVLPWKARESPDAVTRFHREVRAAARLSHPNIVTAFDADEARGVHFLVMEYVNGPDLLTLVKERGPLPVETAIDYILQAARGLEYAHSVKVIHLDIKPANLLLDEDGTVKILDMGLARIDDTAGEALIQSGMVMGTVDYVSPERAHDPQAVDGRADIYSLGCTLFFLLTGKPPYKGDTLKKRILAHRTEPIPSLTASGADVPQGIEAVFRKMVAKNPDDRQATMSQVIADLSACKDFGDPEPLGCDTPPGNPTPAAGAGQDHARSVAERILEIGGTLQVSANGQEHKVSSPEDLPKGIVEVTVVDLELNEQVTGELLQQIRAFEGLQELNLNYSSVTDEGLAHLEGLASLQVLRLGSTQLSRGAREHLMRLTNLTLLELQDTEVADSSIGVLQAALPGCRIIVNPGVQSGAKRP
jgi:serine/threonine protein kinase